jgi:hypothetical protein
MNAFYTLILIMQGGSYAAPAMTSIPRFYERAQCESAGVEYVVQMKGMDSARFVCIRAEVK